MDTGIEKAVTGPGYIVSFIQHALTALGGGLFAVGTVNAHVAQDSTFLLSLGLPGAILYGVGQAWGFVAAQKAAENERVLGLITEGSGVQE